MIVMGIENKHTSCLICSSVSLKKLGNYYKKHQLVKCRSCGFVFMENIPSIEELNEHYAEYSYTSESLLSPLTLQSYNALLDEFEMYRKTNKILDVGCGRGWFLQQAKKRGWEVFGTEYSETALRMCESNGINMQFGKLSGDTFGSEEFDVVTSFEVMEHINNPINELRNIKKFLRTGGLFYCTTPNFNSILRLYLKEDYNVIQYPEHLSYYTKSTLNKLLLEQGFKQVKFLSTGISLSRITASKATEANETGFEKPIKNENADEKLRQKIHDSWYLPHLKTIVNMVLTFFGVGLTLKAYYKKSGSPGS